MKYSLVKDDPATKAGQPGLAVGSSKRLSSFEKETDAMSAKPIFIFVSLLVAVALVVASVPSPAPVVQEPIDGGTQFCPMPLGGMQFAKKGNVTLYKPTNVEINMCQLGINPN